VHPQPDEALCDGPQQLAAEDFAEVAAEVAAVARLLGKQIG
jgi:3-deoxy-7-phosphoheptulonate synthase